MQACTDFRSLRNGDLVLYDCASRKEFKRTGLGQGSAGIPADPDGVRAFVGCSLDNYIAILDLKSFAVAGQLDVDGRVWSEFLLSRFPVGSSTKTSLVCSRWLAPLTRAAARHQKAPATYAASA